MEVILQLTPIMSLTLGLVSLGVERLWVVLPDSPYFASPWHCLLTLLIMAAGGLIAFFMVWAEFALISNTSALTFMVAGTFKEIVTGAQECNAFFVPGGCVCVVSSLFLFCACAGGGRWRPAYLVTMTWIACVFQRPLVWCMHLRSPSRLLSNRSRPLPPASPPLPKL